MPGDNAILDDNKAPSLLGEDSTSAGVAKKIQALPGGQLATRAIDDEGNATPPMDVPERPGYQVVRYGDSPSLGAFGRLRTGEPGNRLDVEFIYDKQEEVFDEVVNGAGTVTHNSNSRDLTLAVVATGTGDNAAMYSYDIPYTPGCSQLIDMTGVFDLAAIGGGTPQIFVRSKVSGSVIETVIDQDNWDFPNADIDWAFSHIVVIDFQSLKVGRIRFNLNRGGVNQLLHEVTNDNVRNVGYWQLPAQPVYWRIYNDATYTYMEMGYGDTDNGIGIRYRIAKNALATMKAICATVKSEGGDAIFDIEGYNRTANMGATPTTVSTTLIPLISIRPKSTFNSIPNKSLAVPIDFTIQTDNPILVVLLHNNTLVGASWVDVDTVESAQEYDISASAAADGHDILSEYVSTTKNRTGGSRGFLGKTLLWNRRGSESGILTLCAIRTTNTDASVLASLNFGEIR